MNSHLTSLLENTESFTATQIATSPKPIAAKIAGQTSKPISPKEATNQPDTRIITSPVFAILSPVEPSSRSSILMVGDGKLDPRMQVRERYSDYHCNREYIQAYSIKEENSDRLFLVKSGTSATSEG